MLILWAILVGVLVISINGCSRTVSPDPLDKINLLPQRESSANWDPAQADRTNFLARSNRWNEVSPVLREILRNISLETEVPLCKIPPGLNIIQTFKDQGPQNSKATKLVLGQSSSSATDEEDTFATEENIVSQITPSWSSNAIRKAKEAAGRNNNPAARGRLGSQTGLPDSDNSSINSASGINSGDDTTEQANTTSTGIPTASPYQAPDKKWLDTSNYNLRAVITLGLGITFLVLLWFIVNLLLARRPKY